MWLELGSKVLNKNGLNKHDACGIKFNFTKKKMSENLSKFEEQYYLDNVQLFFASFFDRG